MPTGGVAGGTSLRTGYRSIGRWLAVLLERGGFGVGAPGAHGVALEHDTVGVVDEAIEDGVGKDRIAEVGVPEVNR